MVSFSVLENKQVRRSFFSVLFMPYNKSFIDQTSSVKMAGYWPRSLFAFLWTETKSRSTKTQKENIYLSMRVETVCAPQDKRNFCVSYTRGEVWKGLVLYLKLFKFFIIR